MAYESLAVIISAVTRLTSGQIGVCRQVYNDDWSLGTVCCRFGRESEVLHTMEQQFTDEVGGNILYRLSFTQSGTSFKEASHYISCHIIIKYIVTCVG